MPQRQVRHSAKLCRDRRAALTGAVLGMVVDTPVVVQRPVPWQGTELKTAEVPQLRIVVVVVGILLWRRGTNCGSSCTFHKSGFSIAELIVVCQCHRSRVEVIQLVHITVEQSVASSATDHGQNRGGDQQFLLISRHFFQKKIGALVSDTGAGGAGIHIAHQGSV